ncbi:MAG: four-helix bundle copper-binding protein [Candidatus Thiodiazotropha sp. (ex Monitilora ramsayi)]|nr:four-helix bundle copper-binding protein [Candidatus Thiodiazotropha sp. (ex Monitilora ramsayi)]
MKKNLSEGLSRRELLIGAGAAATLVASGTVTSAEHMHGDHAGHRHEDHAPKHGGLLDDVNICLDKGQRCISHCFVAFREGDLTLANCASKAQEMLAICEGFSYLVTANSTYLKDYARVCSQVCADCEEECRKHEDKHMECKACAEACAKVVKSINAVMA